MMKHRIEPEISDAESVRSELVGSSRIITTAACCFVVAIQLYLLCYHDGNLYRNGLFFPNIWASSRENLSSEVCEQQGADQSAHSHSLISAFVIRFSKSTISKLATNESSIF